MKTLLAGVLALFASVAVAADSPNYGLQEDIASVLASRTLWGQTFNGTSNVTGSLTAVGDITGGASSMAVTAGTGNSRTLTLKTTTSGGTATAALTLNADQSGTFGNSVTVPITSTIGFASGSSLACASDGVCAITNNAGTSSATLTMAAPVTDRTTNLTLTAAMCGGVYTNSGASGEVDFTLPATAVGCEFEFYVEATQILKVIANTGDTIRLAATVSASAGNIQSTTIGDSWTIRQTSASTWYTKALITTNAGTVSVN